MFNQKNEEKETTVSSIETKQNRLLLDLQILSNLNNKPSDSFNTYLNKSFTDTETETSKKKKSSLIFSPIPENYDFDKNFQNSNNYNMSLNISGKNYTNFNYYLEPINFEKGNNSRNNSVMSFQNLNIPDNNKTNESFYLNFLQPIKYDTDDFINQKRTSDIFLSSTNNNIQFNFDNNNDITSNNNENLDNNIIKKNQEFKKGKNYGKKIILFKTKKGKKTNNGLNINNTNKNSKMFNCEHSGCEGSFITKKLLLSHHKKFNPQCHTDTVLILELIKNAKIILKNINIKNMNNLKNKYDKIMKNISLEEHVQLISGLTFD